MFLAYYRTCRLIQSGEKGSIASIDLVNLKSVKVDRLGQGADCVAHRVLLGLSIEETFEFETLDDQAPLDETGTVIA
jgi:hypothetical protein